MRIGHSNNLCTRKYLTFLGLTLLAILTLIPNLTAEDSDDLDSYKIRFDAGWYFSDPTGNIQGAANNGTVDFQKDLGFTSYSTLTGKIDWKFTRKNHLYVVAAPFNTSHTIVLNRTIVFQGQTFNAGLTTNGSLDSVLVAPGYQYDILRRRRGHLGIGVQIDIFNTTGKLSAAAQTNNNTQHAAVSASASLLAPIPVAGPDFRLYLTNRIFVDGNVMGMYLFGYGNFVSTVDTLGVALTKHIAARAGYQLASDLTVNDTHDRTGLRLTQKGPLVGIEASF
jgi:hypothetical protein